MFTGIIEEQGTIAKITQAKNLTTIVIKAHKVIAGMKLGESLSVNGVCLSVIRIQAKQLSFDMMKETLTATTLGNLKLGDSVNLERAMKRDSRFGGHNI